MIDVKRGIMEGHIPVRSSDGYGDTVKEAIKLYESSKRSGVPVPFRSCHLPEFQSSKTNTTTVHNKPEWNKTESDYNRLWMSWPLLVGFSVSNELFLLSLGSANSHHILYFLYSSLQEFGGNYF
jgi:hypothetical protein